MILFVEGPRTCGKTYLINELIESVNAEVVKNPDLGPFDFDIEYYKFYFANHIKLLNLQRFDNTPALHYFSLGNIMTILEMNQQPQNKDKIWVFDRAIISAYVWSVLRKRLTLTEASDEYLALLSSWLYGNCRTIMVNVDQDRSTEDRERDKDMFGGIHSTTEEQDYFSHFLKIGQDNLSDLTRHNSIAIVTNRFDFQSVNDFISIGKKLLDISLNK